MHRPPGTQPTFGGLVLLELHGHAVPDHDACTGVTQERSGGQPEISLINTCHLSISQQGLRFV